MSDSRYALGLAASSLHVAESLHNVESDKKRKKKMSLIISKKKDAFKLAIDSCDQKNLGLHPNTSDADNLIKWLRHWELDERLTLLIDTLFADPFLPYEIKYTQKKIKIAWEKLANAIEVESESQKKIEDTVANAKKAHRHINWLKIGLSGAAITALFASGAWSRASSWRGASRHGCPCPWVSLKVMGRFVFV